MVIKGLGRGIEAFFQDNVDQQILKGFNFFEAPLASLQANPEQPRKDFDFEELKALSDSIRVKGVIQPILVSQITKNTFQIIAGERRFRAAKLAGLEKVPVVVQSFTKEEVFEISLLENIQRKDLNPIEEALAFQKLMLEAKYTQEILAQRLGKSRPYIANSLRLLKLSALVQKMLVEQKLSPGHARLLLMLESEPLQDHFAKKCVSEQASIKQLEIWISGTLSTPSLKKNKKTTPENWRHKEDLERILTQSTHLKVKIDPSSAQEGWVKIQFDSVEEFNRIYKFLANF